jgi:iron complex transport system ATP-binding protein
VLREVELQLEPGELLGIIGPNGSGKSTLLRIGAGVLHPTRGEVSLLGRPLARLSRREVARTLGYLPQLIHSDFDFTVEEVVTMGRFPHLRGLGFPGPDDLACVDRALKLTGLEPLRSRRISRLSGGERQRVHLAAMIAQEPQIMLLDEPTTALDIQHQVLFFRLLRRLITEGTAVVVVIHDLNLAAQFCTRLALLDRGAVIHSGPPEEVITTQRLRSVYGSVLAVHHDPRSGAPIVLPAGEGPEDSP